MHCLYQAVHPVDAFVNLVVYKEKIIIFNSFCLFGTLESLALIVSTGSVPLLRDGGEAPLRWAELTNISTASGNFCLILSAP